MTLRLLLVLMAVGLPPVCFHSQLLAAPGDEYWDLQFGVPGIRGNVAALALAGHELFVAGLFDSAGGVSTADLARWDGTSWYALKPGLNPELADHVLALAFLGNSLVVGGLTRFETGLGLIWRTKAR